MKSPAIPSRVVYGVVPAEAEMGAVFMITHPGLFDRLGYPVRELIQVVDHMGTVIRGYQKTPVVDWPEGNEISLIGTPMESAGYSSDAHECPTCGRMHDAD